MDLRSFRKRKTEQIFSSSAKLCPLKILSQIILQFTIHYFKTSPVLLLHSFWINSTTYRCFSVTVYYKYQISNLLLTNWFLRKRYGGDSQQK